MIALALAFAVAAQPAGNVEPWTFEAYCYSADLVDVSRRLAYEEQKRQALIRGGKPALDAFEAANPGSGAWPALGSRRKLLMRRAIESGARMDVVDRQIQLFQKNLSALWIADKPRFDKAVAPCRTSA